MTKEQIGSPEQVENELLYSIVENGQVVASRLQQKFGTVFYPMKFVNLPYCKLAYANPGGNYPMSLRMHQIIHGQTAGVEIGLFFKVLPGGEGPMLHLFEDEQNRSSISDTSAGSHSYYFIHQNPDGNLITIPGNGSPALSVETLQTYSEFIEKLVDPLEAALDTSH